MGREATSTTGIQVTVELGGNREGGTQNRRYSSRLSSAQKFEVGRQKNEQLLLHTIFCWSGHVVSPVLGCRKLSYNAFSLSFLSFVKFLGACGFIYRLINR